jgi:hypothetical protein
MAQELSEIFYSLLLTSGIGMVLALARMAYKSKCKSFECCGCKIIRDVQGEEALDMQQQQAQQEMGSQSGRDPESPRV